MSEAGAKHQPESDTVATVRLHAPAAVPMPQLNGRVTEAGLLYPLDEFYLRAGLVVPCASLVTGAEVPEPYRTLLVHERDMTPTLEKHHAERIHLRTIGRRVDGEALSRLVVLTTNESHKPVEFGAIVIHLDQFPAEAREVILGCHVPLGTILADYAIEHFSRPTAFLRVSADPLIHGSLETAGVDALYGRRNVLKTPDGRALADVIEILPPA
jgi:chorismate-pyruvate lyase